MSEHFVCDLCDERIETGYTAAYCRGLGSSPGDWSSRFGTIGEKTDDRG